MPIIPVPSEILDHDIEWLDLKPYNMEVVRNTGAKTVRDLIPFIEDLPEETKLAIKKKVMFNMPDE